MAKGSEQGNGGSFVVFGLVYLEFRPDVHVRIDTETGIR